MRLIDRLARPASEARAFNPWPGESNPTWAGSDVSTTSSLQLLTVYGCVRLIADAIATLPIDVYSEKPDGTRVEVAPPSWLGQPTPYLDRTAWTTQVLTSLLLAGNAYVWQVYNQGRLSELVPLDPSKVQVQRVNGRKVYLVSGVPMSTFDILHIPGLMFPGSDVGLSPVEAARQTIGVGMSAQEFGARLFSQGLTAGAAIEVPGEMSEPQARAMAQAISRRHGGKAKAHLPIVLEGGATWKSTSVTPEQAQFLETRNYTAAEIAGQMFLVDPADLGIGVQGTSLTYANLEQRNLRRVQVTYLPWIVRLEAAYKALLGTSHFAKLNVDGLLRADLKTRMDSYKIGVDLGIYGVDLPRDLEDIPLPNGGDLKPATFTAKAEAAGQLIRAGFEPGPVLAAVGLPPIAHTGLVPITVTEPDTGGSSAAT